MQMFTRIPINMGILDSRYQQKIRKGFPQVSYETKSLSLLPAIWTFNLIFPTSQGENAEECQPHTHVCNQYFTHFSWGYPSACNPKII